MDESFTVRSMPCILKIRSVNFYLMPLCDLHKLQKEHFLRIQRCVSQKVPKSKVRSQKLTSQNTKTEPQCLHVTGNQPVNGVLSCHIMLQ